MKQNEVKIQKAIAQFIRLKYPDVLMTISPAGFVMSAGMAMKVNAMGYRKGTPDLMFFEPRGGYHGLVLEVKDPNGSLSTEQREFIDTAIKLGYKGEVCYSVTQGKNIIDRYMDWPREI
jgi:hypothetical protein